MCTGMEIAAIVGAAGSLAGGLGVGKGKEKEVKQAISPEQEKLQKFLSRYLMGNAGKYAPINPLSLGGMDVASQFYLGKPYQQPGFQQAPTGGGNMDPRSVINRNQLAPGGGNMFSGGGGNMFGGGGRWQPQQGGPRQRKSV